MINKISGVNQLNLGTVSFGSKVKPQEQKKTEFNVTNYAQLPLGNIYGAKINFVGRKKKAQVVKTPAQDLYAQSSRGSKLKVDHWTQDNLYHGVNRPDKKWVAGVAPSELLNRSLKDAINSNLTLVYGDNMPDYIPTDIKTPNYGDNWGRHANYIEINNRAIAEMHGDRTNSGILGAIKLLPAIPPSHDKWANCLLVSQLYPNIWGDGWNNNGENSLYGIKLEYERASDNIGWVKVGNKVFTPEEQIKAFNDLAHLRGFKTSFRMLISEDQIKLGDSGQFRWNNPDHVEAFIIACCKGIELGFDGIFFDSLKHVGGYDWGHYAGVGAVPSYDQMAYILAEVRRRTGRSDISFSGEKAEGDSMRYKNMGVTAGASQMSANSVDEVKGSARSQAWCQDFAWGPVVSDDNDEGLICYSERMNKINSALFGYSSSQDKLPSFMQMHDLFPLNYGTNTHQLMLENRNFSLDGTPKSHYDNLFANGAVERNYRNQVSEKFAWAYNYNPA